MTKRDRHLALFIAFAAMSARAAPTTPATPATPSTTAPPTLKIIAPGGGSATTPTPTAPPTEPTGKGALLMGEAALRAGLANKCIELSKEAVRSGTLDEKDLAAAWLLRGRCHALDGDADRAERSYAVATRVLPTATLPARDTIWERVRPEGSDPATALVLIAAGVVVGEHEVGLEITTQDDLVLGATIVVVDAAGTELARAPTQEVLPSTVTPPAPTPPPPVRAVRHRFSGFNVEGTTTKLLDRNGNVLRAVPVELDDRAKLALSAPTASTPVAVPVAAVATTTAPPGVGVLGYVGAGVAVAGFVGAAVCGVNLATTAQADPAQANDDEFPFVVGVIGGAVVMVVGMGLVVVDGL